MNLFLTTALEGGQLLPRWLMGSKAKKSTNPMFLCPFLHPKQILWSACLSILIPKANLLAD